MSRKKPALEVKINSQLVGNRPKRLGYFYVHCSQMQWVLFVAVIEDDHLLNATYYSPDIEEPLDSTAMLGNIVHSESPTHFQTGGGGGGGTTFNGGSLHHSHSHQHGGSQSHIDTAASVGKSKSIKNHLHISMKRQQQYSQIAMRLIVLRKRDNCCFVSKKPLLLRCTSHI